MLLREVEYARPSSVEEALRLLASHEGARALAGGQTLINVMKARVAAPDVVVDLSRLDELRAIRFGDDHRLQIGAMATYSQLMASSEIDVARPIVAQVSATIADVQVRNRGTIGGNVCSNDPTNHLPPLMVAVGADMTIIGPSGERTVTARDFFLGVYTTAVGPDELLTHLTIPAGRADGFAAITIGKDGTCIANAAATMSDDGPMLVLGCVDAVPVVVPLDGDDDQSVRAAVARAGLVPPDDVHAPSSYRLHLAGISAVRALRQARERSR